MTQQEYCLQYKHAFPTMLFKIQSPKNMKIIPNDWYQQ